MEKVIPIMLAASLGFIGCATVSTNITIPAEPKAVWSVLADGPGYKEWNPVLVPLEGALKEGNKVKYEMTGPGEQKSEVKAKVKKVVKEKKLNQCGGIPGILTFNHTWSLEPIEGGTRVTQHEEYRGIGVLFWDRSWVEPAYASANEALKKRVAQLNSNNPDTLGGS